MGNAHCHPLEKTFSKLIHIYRKRLRCILFTNEITGLIANEILKITTQK